MQRGYKKTYREGDRETEKERERERERERKSEEMFYMYPMQTELAPLEQSGLHHAHPAQPSPPWAEEVRAVIWIRRTKAPSP